MGLGLAHFVPLVAYLGFWVMIIASLAGKPQLGFYYMMPFLPYRTLRDHFFGFPLGGNMLTILVLAIIVGAAMRGKRLPKSKLYLTWLILAIYLYFSMWFGTVLSNAPAPLWISDLNFVTWKDYMMIPLVFVAGGLVIEDRKSVRTVVLLTAITLVLIDRSCILESMSRSWGSFDENKRDPGPLSYGANQTAAFLAQFALFFWGMAHFIKRWKVKLAGYVLVGATIFALMYTFSRGGYLALLAGVLILGVMKDRKLLIAMFVFLLTWQTVVPVAVRQRVLMTKDSSGQLEASAQERVDLWTNAVNAFERSPIVGNGYATFQMGEHVDDLKDTHNWYVKVMVETGVVGMLIVSVLLVQMLGAAYRVFRRATDPLYRGLGLGLLGAIVGCLVANCFGDRWTYLEITALLWVLVAAALRATEFSAAQADGSAPAVKEPMDMRYMAYR